MTGYEEHRCLVHGVALRGDGRCFMCERDRKAGSSSPPGTPRFEVQERRQAPTVTVLLALAFFTSVALTVLWIVSPELLTGLFD